MNQKKTMNDWELILQSAKDDPTDENSKEVSSQIFYQKCNSSDLYNCLSYKYDGVIISKKKYK